MQSKKEHNEEHSGRLKNFNKLETLNRDKWVPVTMVWHVLMLQMEDWPPDMESSCEYIE
jgi:hypothetical protein